ncbi:MAG: VOC family protein [Rhizobiales bacterium]|nr:VOC family protein [Hyphomicrobiales bacterium]OJU37966.1 MAG: glyoxalase [Rhizobiales bacterium 68-8]
MHAKSFFWYELMTPDMKGAEAFYTAVVGWTPQAFDPGGGMPYTVLNAGERGIGGIMPMPQADLPPAWVGYVYTPDIDAACESLKKAGGKVHRPPTEIPTVGRFAVVGDPQGAMFMFLAPQGPDQPPIDRAARGQVGWHELYTSDWRAALDFYSGQFGWTKEDEFDMGEMGIYALFGFEKGRQAGGMMDKPDQIPVPVWQFYFNVEGIDAAAGRVTGNGGKVLMGPMEVPGGSWVVQCQDPQGAHFALLSATR